MIYTIQNLTGSAPIREGLNANAEALRKTRRPWESDFDGPHCTHNGKDYDLLPGGIATEAPGNPDHWAERQYVAAQTGVVSGLQFKRGTLGDLKAEPANSTVELFTVQFELVNEYDEDMNGDYRKTASGQQYIWVKQ